MVVEIPDSGPGYGFPNSVDLSLGGTSGNFSITVPGGKVYVFVSWIGWGSTVGCMGSVGIADEKGVIESVRVDSRGGYIDLKFFVPGSSGSSKGYTCDYRDVMRCYCLGWHIIRPDVCPPPPCPSEEWHLGWSCSDCCACIKDCKGLFYLEQVDISCSQVPPVYWSGKIYFDAKAPKICILSDFAW